jgi:hypothetical protein
MDQHTISNPLRFLLAPATSPGRATRTVALAHAMPGHADGVRISGFRLIGPSFGDQTKDNYGITIARCRGVRIANMEIAGWGGASGIS